MSALSQDYFTLFVHQTYLPRSPLPSHRSSRRGIPRKYGQHSLWTKRTSTSSMPTSSATHSILENSWPILTQLRVWKGLSWNCCHFQLSSVTWRPIHKMSFLQICPKLRSQHEKPFGLLSKVKLFGVIPPKQLQTWTWVHEGWHLYS